MDIDDGLIYSLMIVFHGIELWGCASKTNINIIQRLQSKMLRAMTNAPWYVSNDTLHNDLGMSNDTLHNDLGIPIIYDVIKERSNKHHNRLETHTNPLMQPLLLPLLEEPICIHCSRNVFTGPLPSNFKEWHIDTQTAKQYKKISFKITSSLSIKLLSNPSGPMASNYRAWPPPRTSKLWNAFNRKPCA
jgi:hypothetical protein